MINREALFLFKEKGYKKVTVDEIVKVCNTSKGSFYHHYNSKADILNEHFTLVDKYYEKIYADLPTNISAKERLEKFLKEMYFYLEESLGRDFLKVIYSTSLEYEAHQYFRNPNRKLFEIYKVLLGDIIQANASPYTLPLNLLNQSLIQLTMGIIYYWCTVDQDLTLQECSIASINHFINGFQ